MSYDLRNTWFFFILLKLFCNYSVKLILINFYIQEKLDILKLQNSWIKKEKYGDA